MYIMFVFGNTYL